MSMRDVKTPEQNKGEGLFRTMSMAFVIAGIIAFVAMFWALRTNAPEGAGLDYYLPWCLPYGIVDLLIAGTGVAFTTLSKEKPGLYKPGEFGGIAVGALLIGQSVPLVIWLNNWEFCISVAVIGVCIIVISALGLASLREEDNPA